MSTPEEQARWEAEEEEAAREVRERRAARLARRQRLLDLHFQRNLQVLGTITTRDEHGRHFTSVYPEAELQELEDCGYIRVDRPVHQPSGVAMSIEHWTVEVTNRGQDLVDEAGSRP